MSHTTLIVLFSLLMVPGIFGVLLPFVPGISYMLLVALLFGIIDSFTALSGAELLMLAGITVLSLIIDYSAGVLGARYGGANWKSILAGIVGFFIGFVTFPPLGSVVGLFIGIAVGEYIQGHSRHKAITAATASMVGTVTGALLNFILAIAFLVLFIFFVW